MADTFLTNTNTSNQLNIGKWQLSDKLSDIIHIFEPAWEAPP